MPGQPGFGLGLVARLFSDRSRPRTLARWNRYALLDRCLAHEEPALLVGDTGTGKTTVCQMAAFVRGQRLHIFNCNQYTEASDLLGGFRPNRCRGRAGARRGFHPGIGCTQC